MGDIQEDDPLLQDEDIQFELEGLELSDALPINRSICIRAAVTLLTGIIAQMARRVTYTIGPEKVELSKQLDNYERLLANLKKVSQESHACAPITIPTSPGEYYFNAGLHDNRGGF